MTVVSLDSIVRNVLMQRQYPLHWYIQFLVYARNCLQEISMDDLYVVNTKLLPVNAVNAVDLPPDFLDYVKVGVQVGQTIRPLVEDNGINRLTKLNSNFEPVPYLQAESSDPSEVQQQNLGYSPNFFNYWYTINWNLYGENIGRYFGGNAYADTFSLIRERNQIQLHEKLNIDYLYLEYVSNGMNTNAATMITPYAFATIEAFILWKLKEHSRTYSIGERQIAEQQYIQQRKILRARISSLTISELKRIVNKNIYAAPKS